MHRLTPDHYYRGTLFIATLLLVGLLWQYPFVLFVGVLLLLLEVNRSLKWRYIKTSSIVMIIGPLAEAVAMAFNAWSYSLPSILGFPLWLAPVWGCAALFFLALGEFVKEIPIGKAR